MLKLNASSMGDVKRSEEGKSDIRYSENKEPTNGFQRAVIKNTTVLSQVPEE